MEPSRQISGFVQLLLLLMLAAFSIYFLPATVNRLLFLIVLPLAWKSKRDYFWLAFFFILLDYPGGLFHGGGRSDLFRLPLYSFMPGFGFAIQELFYILMFIKALNKKREGPPSPFYDKNINALAVLFALLVAISPLMGMSLNSFRLVYKIAISLSLFYSTYRLLPSKEQLYKFFRLVFPFAFIAALFIVYSLLFKQQIIALLKPGVSVTQGGFGIDGQIDRPIEMMHILFLCFSGSLVLLANADHDFNRYYLVTVNLLSFLGIFLSATRSWFLAFSAAYLLFLWFTLSKSSKNLRYAMILAPLLALAVFSVPLLRNQFNSAWTRLATVEEIAAGDATAGGTMIRLSVRMPRVMKGFWSSSVLLGAGFSDRFFEFADYHVPYPNILLNSGIIGSLILFFFILKLLARPFRRRSSPSHIRPPHAVIAIIPLVMLLILNSGTQTIGFSFLGDCRVFLMAYAVLMIKAVEEDADDICAPDDGAIGRDRFGQETDAALRGPRC